MASVSADDSKDDGKDESKHDEKKDPGDGLPTKATDAIEFEWSAKMTALKACDTRHTLFLLQSAMDLVRMETIARNKHFKSLGRTERYIAHFDAAQIISNFVRWHNDEPETHKFNGAVLEQTEARTVINDFIAAIGLFTKNKSNL